MSVYVVTAVELSENGRVIAAMGGKVDPANNQFKHQPAWIPASDLASKIVGGDEVRSAINVDGHRVLGPAFRRVVYAGGEEGIELEDHERFTINDLVLHDPA
jgi:hypothetical protein